MLRVLPRAILAGLGTVGLVNLLSLLVAADAPMFLAVIYGIAFVAGAVIDTVIRCLFSRYLKRTG